MRRTCEICGDVVVTIEKASTCGHPVYLCEDCKRDCPGARRLCARCEDAGVDPEPRSARHV